MSFAVKLNPALEKLPVYLPGRPIDEVAREIGIDAKSIIKMASNESPLGPSPKAMQVMKENFAGVNLYPDGSAYYLRKKVSEKLNLPGEYLAFANGSNEMLELIGHAALSAGDDCIMTQYCFAVYPIVTRLFGANPIVVPAKNFGNDTEAMLKAITPKTKIIFMANPSNPTGATLSEKELKDFIKRVPEHVLVVVDEAYTEYADCPADLISMVRDGSQPNLIVSRTFSKIYGLAGLRIGYAVAHPDFVKALNQVREPFNTNLMAQLGAAAALDDEEFLKHAKEVNKQGLRYLRGEFEKMGLEYVPTEANFLLVKVGDGVKVFQEMQKLGVIIRPVANYKLPEWIRITVGTAEQNEHCISCLKKVLGR